jgi:hypothetical protein
MIKRVIVDTNNSYIAINREHLLGYIHALEELSESVSADISEREIQLSNDDIRKYNQMLIDNIDYMRTKAVRDLGRFEMTNNPIWMDD